MVNNKRKNIIIIRTTSIKNDSRVIKQATYLLNNGYNVKILGWDRDGFLDGDNKIEIQQKIIPIQVFKKKSQYGAGMKSIFKLFKFQIWLLYNLIKQRKNIDIIHSCDLDTAIPARIVATIFKKKLVYDIFDYYIHSHYVPKKIEKIVENLEINIINKSNLTIICTEQRKEQIKKANPKKCIVIYNTPQIIEDKINKRIIKSNNNKIKIGYVGILQENRLLEEIGEEIKRNNEFELHIGGFGNLQNYFEKNESDCDNIFYYGQMEYKDVLALEKDCDILFATYDPSIPNHKYSAPNKLYEAMALGKPIIVCKNTGIDEIVEQNNLGAIINYNEKEFINAVIKIKENKEDVDKLKEKSQQLFKEKYSSESNEKRIKEAYEEILGEKK